MVLALSQPSAGAWAGPAAATAGVIRRDEVFTSLEESEQVALVFLCTAPWDRGRRQQRLERGLSH